MPPEEPTVDSMDQSVTYYVSHCWRCYTHAYCEKEKYGLIKFVKDSTDSHCINSWVEKSFVCIHSTALVLPDKICRSCVRRCRCCLLSTALWVVDTSTCRRWMTDRHLCAPVPLKHHVLLLYHVLIVNGMCIADFITVDNPVDRYA